MNYLNFKNLKFAQSAFFMILFVLGLTSSYSQNSCATALPINVGLYTVDAVNGTNITSTCSSASMAEWYAYTPTQNYSVTVTSDLAQNICKDTNFSVYTGVCGTLTCLTSDDDSGIIQCNSGNTNSYLSIKTFEVSAGTTYYIAWDNRWSAVGFDFQLIEAPIVPSPCSTATTITAGTHTVNAIDGTNITTSCSNSSFAKWYKYIPTQSYQVTVTSDLAENICKDTNFSVYTGTCSGTLTCIANDDNSGIIACNNGNTNSNLSVKTFIVNAGTTYYIVWDNKWSTEGFNFQLIEAAIPPPPISYNNQTISTISTTYNLCIVDMNGDHNDDIVGVSTNNLRVHFQGSTPGNFTVTDFPFTGATKLPTWSMAAGDYNKDGYNDMVFGGSGGLSIVKSNNTGTEYTGLTPGEYIFCQRTNFADLNKDGNLDVFSCHDVDDNVYYMNDGNANLTYYQSNTTAGSMNLSVAGGNYATLFTDFDNDSDTDVFISKCSGPPCQMFRYDGGNTYTNVSSLAGINITPIQTWSSAIADFDNDGDMDIIITSSASAHHFFRNNFETTGTLSAFTEITVGSGWDTNPSTNIDNIAYDFDNDGFVDVLGGGNKIMFNQGDGTFVPQSYSSISVGAVGDLNNDGFLDIQNGTTIRYAVPNGNNWIKVKLQGIQSNSNGIGARVEIYGTFGKQIRDIRSGEGFKYMSSLNAHFGLGQNTEVTQVIIRWPSGLVDTISNPSINQALYVVEGSTLSNNQFENKDFSIYPNPAKNSINIVSSNNFNFTMAKVYDLSGRLITSANLENNSINVEKLSIGTYMLILTDDFGNEHSQKFIKE